MQIFRYMAYIWEDYEKRMEAKQKGISKTKDFKYPPILPIVYYEGKEAWTAQMELKDRIVGSDIFCAYVPNYRYHLIRVDDYSKEELIAKEDELSIVCRLNHFCNYTYRIALKYKDVE